MEQVRKSDLKLKSENKTSSKIEKLRVLKIKDLKANIKRLEDEIKRRNEGVQEEIKGIQASTELSEAKKQILIGKAKQIETVNVEADRLLLELKDRLYKLTFRTVL